MQNINRTYDRPPVDQLTPTEQKVYDLYKEGKSRKEIGEALGMKVNSVGRRITAIREKVALQ